MTRGRFKVFKWLVFGLLGAFGFLLGTVWFALPSLRVGPLVQTQPSDGSLTLYVLGDTGTGGKAQRSVAGAMEKRCRTEKPDGILLLGDMFYQTGVQSVDDPQWRPKVIEPYQSGCLSGIPLFPVLGNHDYKGNAAAQIRRSGMSSWWKFPHRFYALKFDELVRVVAFDSAVSEFCFHPAVCSLDFLLWQTGFSDTAWTLVMAHHPLASASAHGHGHSGGLRDELLLPLLCERVDFWLAGHAHHLEHRRHAGCRVESFISGGGGADLYPLEKPHDETVAYAAAKHGFLELQINEERLVSRFIAPSGKILYESLKKPF